MVVGGGCRRTCSELEDVKTAWVCCRRTLRRLDLWISHHDHAGPSPFLPHSSSSNLPSFWTPSSPTNTTSAPSPPASPSSPSLSPLSSQSPPNCPASTPTTSATAPSSQSNPPSTSPTPTLGNTPIVSLFASPLSSFPSPAPFSPPSPPPPPFPPPYQSSSPRSPSSSAPSLLLNVTCSFLTTSTLAISPSLTSPPVPARQHPGRIAACCRIIKMGRLSTSRSLQRAIRAYQLRWRLCTA